MILIAVSLLAGHSRIKMKRGAAFAYRRKRSYKTYRNTSVMSLFSRTYFQISKYDRRKCYQGSDGGTFLYQGASLRGRS